MKMQQYKSETTRLLMLQSFPLFKNKILTPAIVEYCGKSFKISQCAMGVLV